MQAHNDHVAAMAEMKRFTHAKLLATAGDKPLLEDGGASDFVLKDPNSASTRESGRHH